MRKIILALLLLFSLVACAEEETTTMTTQTIKPVISLNGEAVISIEAGSEYIELATAIAGDNNADLTVVGEVDTSTLGTYTLTYSCTINGISADKLTRTVNVVDTTAPTVIFDDDVDAIEFGESIEDYYTISDNYDDFENLTIIINGIDNLTELGNHDLEFILTDTLGNTVTITKEITLVDTEAPTIDFPEYDNFEHEQGVPFQSNMIIYSDNYDSNENIVVVETGTVDVDALGAYEVSYYVEDTSGNRSETITKNITVVEASTETLSEDHQFMKENTAFYDPIPFNNAYIHDATETVYRGVVIENGQYRVVYFMFFHNWFDGGKVLSAFEFVKVREPRITIELDDSETDFVFEIPLNYARGIFLTVVTIAHDDFESETRSWTATFSFVDESNLDPYQIFNENLCQGNLK